MRRKVESVLSFSQWPTRRNTSRFQSLWTKHSSIDGLWGSQTVKSLIRPCRLRNKQLLRIRFPHTNLLNSLCISACMQSLSSHEKQLDICIVRTSSQNDNRHFVTSQRAVKGWTISILKFSSSWLADIYTSRLIQKSSAWIPLTIFSLILSFSLFSRTSHGVYRLDNIEGRLANGFAFCSVLWISLANGIVMQLYVVTKVSRKSRKNLDNIFERVMKKRKWNRM